MFLGGQPFYEYFSHASKTVHVLNKILKMDFTDCIKPMTGHDFSNYSFYIVLKC